mgnify:CR=1 FL=1
MIYELELKYRKKQFRSRLEEIHRKHKWRVLPQPPFSLSKFFALQQERRTALCQWS